MKIMVVTVVTTLLVASPAFASVFVADAGFLQDTTLDGAGFHLTAGSIISR